MAFKDRLKLARENAGYIQGDLAKLCGWDSGQSRIANYESGDREPTLNDIEKLARALGLPPEELAFASVGLSEDELNLVQAWRLADADAKNVFRQLMKISGRPKNKRQSPKNK